MELYMWKHFVEEVKEHWILLALLGVAWVFFLYALLTHY